MPSSTRKPPSGGSSFSPFDEPLIDQDALPIPVFDPKKSTFEAEEALLQKLKKDPFQKKIIQADPNVPLDHDILLGLHPCVDFSDYNTYDSNKLLKHFRSINKCILFSKEAMHWTQSPLLHSAY